MCVVGLLLWFVKENRHKVILDNFGVVVPEQLYRSGQLTPRQFDKLIEKYGLKTIINTREPDAPAEIMAAEKAVCDARGIRMVRLMMPGDGKGSYDQYDQALEILSNPTNLPALVHCARGTHRTGALIAVYRVRKEGVVVDQALSEMENYRYDPEGHALTPYLLSYFGER